MNRINTHVCMVSGQPAPNLLPLLDEALKPKRIVLLVTPQMQDKAGWLESVIKPLGIKVELMALEAAENFDAIQEKLLTLLDQEDSSSIALNATGGTKWMAIAAQEVFRAHNAPVFYVNIANDTVLFLGEKQQPHKLQQRINLDTFLKANGYTLVSDSKPQGLPESERQFCQQLVLKVVEWEQALGQLNLLASLAEQRNTLQVNLQDLNSEANMHMPALMAELRFAGLLQSADQPAIRFRDEHCRTFANGGWLEAYVNSLLNEMKSEGVIQDSARLNLTIRSAKKSVNELDVAFMANNHLHIIECKTKRFAGSHVGMAGAETVYKLDSISALGGLGTRSMLVSYRRLRDADLQRARDLRIEVVEGSAIQKLKLHLRDWIQRDSSRAA